MSWRISSAMSLLYEESLRSFGKRPMRMEPRNQNATNTPPSSMTGDARLMSDDARPSSNSRRCANPVRFTGKGFVIVEFDGMETVKVMRGVFDRKTYRIDETVNAYVETAANLGSRPTLIRTAAGFGLTGTPIGAVCWKKPGAVLLVIEAAAWAELIEVPARKVAAARKFALRVNLVARQAAGEMTSAESGAIDDVSDRPAFAETTTEDPAQIPWEAVASPRPRPVIPA